MDVKINEKIAVKNIKVCDLIVINNEIFKKNNPYIIMDEKDGFILRSLKTGRGATGHRTTFESLISSLGDYGYTHYSQDEYQLVLERKG